MKQTIKPLFTSTLAAGIAATLCGSPVNAEHFNTHITVRSAAGIAEGSWDTSPPEGGFNPRQVVSASVGEDLLLEWSVSAEYPHGIMKQVGMRLYVAPEEKVGQKKEPPANAKRILDNRFTCDFHPHYSARGHVHFRVILPGRYLVRLQSENTSKEHGHEHFAAVDLEVK